MTDIWQHYVHLATPLTFNFVAAFITNERDQPSEDALILFGGKEQANKFYRKI